MVKSTRRKRINFYIFFILFLIMIGLCSCVLQAMNILTLPIPESAVMLISISIFWVGILLLQRNKMELTLDALHQYADQISQGKQGKQILAKSPELSPIFQKINDYTYKLEQHNQSCLHSNSLLISIMEGISDGFFSLDTKWRFIYLNQTAKRMSFNEDGNLIGKNIWEEFPHAVSSESYHIMHQASVSNAPTHWETHAPVTDKYYLYSAYPFEQGLSIFIRDITDKKRLKNKLVHLASIVESTNDAIIGETLDGIITAWNLGAQRLFGYTEHEMIGKHVSVLVPEGMSYENHILEMIRNGEKVKGLETLRQTKYGDEVHVSLTVSPIIDKQKKVIGTATIARDITNLKAMEYQLQKEVVERRFNEALFRATFDNSRLGIITLTIHGKIIRTNRSFQQMVGYSQEELQDRHWKDITYPEDISLSEQYLNQLLFGQYDHYEFEKRYIHKNGTLIYAQDTVVISREPNVEFIIGFIQDISDKQILQEQIARFDSLNLVGEMAAGISHEVRNPMTTVRGFLQMLSQKEECKNFEDYFELMIEELDRANSIITEFLSIGKNMPDNLEKINLNNIVKSLVPLIEANAYGQDKYLVVVTESLPDLMVNSKEIRQIILNLCQNGLEAMTEGGTLTIRTYMQNGKVILAIQDEGEGIKPEFIEKLGTPFFTTKKTGTGLGLGICYKIATRNNARIDFDTGSTGTTFYVRFDPVISIE